MGGIAARRLPSPAVVTLSHSLSLVLLISLALIHGSTWPDTPSVVYGALAGVACGTGVMVLYKALALGGMGLTAAVSGVLAAVMPVIWAFATEGLPREPQIAGIALAGVAIWMIARAPGSPCSEAGHPIGRRSRRQLDASISSSSSRGAGGAVAAGVFAYSRALHWQPSSPGSGCGVAAETNSSAKLPWPGWAMLGSDRNRGCLRRERKYFLYHRDAAGTAGHRGGADFALYPASTILLAAVLLKERTRHSQAAGMALALVAVVFISV